MISEAQNDYLSWTIENCITIYYNKQMVKIKIDIGIQKQTVLLFCILNADLFTTIFICFFFL